ncbi:hypothetical protein BT96DRAFT_771415, partial [Gymnopus androsaceus JB14]
MANLIQSDDHSPDALCKYDECEFIRETYNCEHPHGCAQQATKLLNTLPPKWDPRSELPEDYQEPPKIHPNEIGNKIQFDSQVTTKGTLTDIFQIFTDKKFPTTNKLP